MARWLQPTEVADWVSGVLFDEHRRVPVVAVTTPHASRRTWVSPEALEQTLGAEAEVVCLETGDATWELTDAMPPRLDAYGGAVRIWWPGLRADSDPYDHRLYFVRSPEEATEVFAAVVRAVQEGGRPAEQAGQGLGCPDRRYEADLDLRLTEPCALRGEAAIRVVGELQPAADGDAPDRGQDGFGRPAQQADARVAQVDPFGHSHRVDPVEDAQVRADAEIAVDGRRQDDDADVRVADKFLQPCVVGAQHVPVPGIPG